MKNILNSQKALAETFTLTAFFRSLVGYSYSEELINYLILISWLNKQELQNRWDWFDSVFWDEYWKKISALSFSTIIEARSYLLDSLLELKIDKNSIVFEVASWFSPRAINIINNKWFIESQYIETDKSEIIWLKQWFYDSLSWIKTTILIDFNVVNDDILELEKKVLWLKQINNFIDKLFIINEWLLIYLTLEEQKKYFNILKELSKKLKKYWITLEYLSIDMPTHENFTDWLLYEWFTHKDHIEVMKKVDPIILNCLHNTEKDFFINIWFSLNNIKKYYYSDNIIWMLKTWKLDKYNNIIWIDDKIKKFLKQKKLYAYSIIL